MNNQQNSSMTPYTFDLPDNTIHITQYRGVGSIDISISEWKDPVDSDDITNRSFGVELVLSVTDKVKFINTDGITVYYDNNSIQLNGLVEQCFILIKEASSFRYTNNQYGSVSVRFISLQ